MTRLIAFNKPFGVLSQFTDGGARPTLAGFIAVPGVYPAGRLDRDSEGLLLLTDDGQLQARIADPRYKLPKTYWVQVEGEPDAAQLAQLQRGVTLNDGPTLPAEAAVIAAPELWPRNPPVRFRKSVPDSWISLTAGGSVTGRSTICPPGTGARSRRQRQYKQRRSPETPAASGRRRWRSTSRISAHSDNS